VGGKALAEYVGESRPTGVIVVPESTVEALRRLSPGTLSLSETLRKAVLDLAPKGPRSLLEK